MGQKNVCLRLRHGTGNIASLSQSGQQILLVPEIGLFPVAFKRRAPPNTGVDSPSEQVVYRTTGEISASKKPIYRYLYGTVSFMGLRIQA